MKKHLITIFLILFCIASLAITPSAQVVETPLYDGVTYKEEHITNTDGNNADVFSLAVNLKKAYAICGLPDNIKALQIGASGRQTLTEMVKAAQRDGYTVYAAMNADFFYISDDTKIQPEGIVIRDGKLLNPIGEYSSFFGILNDGTARIGHINEYIKLIGQVDQAVGGDYGYLIKNGEPITEDKDGGWHAVGYADPRSAVGIKADGSIFMVIVDGRTSKSRGVTLTQLANYMKQNGCVSAINLDGGGSAQIGICDPETKEFKIVNNPSDGVERPVANAILVVSDQNPNVPAKAPTNAALSKSITIIVGFSLVLILFITAFIINLKNSKEK